MSVQAFCSRTLVRAAFGALLLGALASCTSSSSSPAPGTVRVSLVDGPVDGLLEVNVHILRVEIQGPNGWQVLNSPDKVVNLLSLTGGIVETLVAGQTLPVGNYTMLRLILGANSTVKLADGTVKALEVPSGLQTGIKMPGSFDVAAGTTKDLWIDFDAAHSIQFHTTGNGKAMLRPVVRVYDKVVTGSITGILKDGADQSALPDALVTAQVQDASGARVVRATRTKADGTYALDLLPVGASYTIVSQPVAGAKTFEAQASPATALSTTTAVVGGVNFTFTAAAASGTVTGTCTPVPGASDADTVEVLKTLSGQSWVVRTGVGVAGATSSVATFTLVPTGAYGARAARTTLAGDGSSSSVTRVWTGALDVTNGGTSAVSFTF